METSGEEDEELDNSAVEKALIKNKTTYMAPVNKNPALELFLRKVDDEIKEYKEKKSLGDNLTKDERKALNEMIHWNDVVIRPYDKGSGFTIEDKTSYISMQ